LRVGGRRLRRSFKRPKEAEAFVKRIQGCTSDAELLLIVHETDTLHEWFEKWLRDYSTRTLELVSAEFYIGTYTRHIEPVLGKVRLRDLPNRLQRWANAMARRGSKRYVGRPTAKKAFSTLSSILRFAVVEQALKENPMEKVVFPAYRGTSHNLQPAPTPLFVERVLHLLTREDDRLLVQLMAYAGLRPAEALAVCPAIIRLQPGTLMLNVSIVRGQPAPIKNKRPHFVPLLAPLREVIGKYLASNPQLDPVKPLIVGDTGAPWSADEYRAFRRRFERAARQAGEPFRPKDLRAGYATMMHESGTPIESVAAHMGDSLTTVKGEYVRFRVDPERLLSPEEQIRRARAQVAANPPRRNPGGRPRRAA
jgi:integrase